MNLKLITFLCLSCFMITACTSSESALKKQAVQLGEQKMREAFKIEADDQLKQSTLLHDGYIEFLTHQSEVQVEDLQIQNGNLATVTVTMTTLPLKLRRTLLEIAAKVEPAKSRRFNFSEAVKLIRQQMGEELEKEAQPLGVYRFRKAQDSWLAEEQGK